MPEYQYAPQIFNVVNRSGAMNIILTPQSGMDSQQRWDTETPHLFNLITKHTDVGPECRVLDYGCGIGRLSRELIARLNASVVGVDISWSMRALAMDYVRSDKFFVCSPDWLDILLRSLSFDLALAIWVLQHCVKPEEDIDRIALALKRSHGRLFVVNQINRLVPVLADNSFRWAEDQIEIMDLLARKCSDTPIIGKLDPRVVGEEVSQSTFWGVYSF